ncbi:MAG: triose-phosphate isomerase [Clostridia bacterium]|nr:triose-phosphate isomerase [Clostridia bacterium]MBP5781510.1 triose-phosphate isomerase [Clostridia bacterium]
MSNRKLIIAGNWKMNKTPAEASSFIKELKPLIKRSRNEVVCAVPFVDIQTSITAARGSRIKIAAQNMHFEEKGAYTGEVSGQMLKSMGVTYVIIGHSERREYFAETNRTVNKKVIAAYKCGLKPIICVGESLAQREAGLTAEHIRYQVKAALVGVTADQVKKAVIAYEPIWAIGTGRTATAEQAQEVCHIIRMTIKELYSKRVSSVVRIQYGGSVKADNAHELFSMEDIDGGLVGGASLKLSEFAAITAG